LSIEQEKRNALFTRFVKLFEEFFHRSQVTLQSVDLDLPKLQKIFYHSWDKKVLPSKQVLMKSVHIRPGPMSFAGISEDDVAKAFAAALEALEIEEHNEEASLLQHPQQKSRPGQPADPKIKQRGEIVRKHIHSKKDFLDEEKKQVLLREFEENEIPLPTDRYGFLKYPGRNWQELMGQSAKWEKVVDDILNRDRFPRKSKITTE